MPSQTIRGSEVVGSILESPVVTQLQAPGNVGVEVAVAVDEGVVDRLQGGEPVTDLGHVRPCFRRCSGRQRRTSTPSRRGGSRPWRRRCPTVGRDPRG